MIALVVVLAGLGAYIYFVDSKRPAAGIEEKEKVFAVEADKIEEITVTSDAETSTLRKVDGTWRLTAPIEADADQTEISSLASSLSTLEVNRVVDENAVEPRRVRPGHSPHHRRFQGTRRRDGRAAPGRQDSRPRATSTP